MRRLACIAVTVGALTACGGGPGFDAEAARVAYGVMEPDASDDVADRIVELAAETCALSEGTIELTRALAMDRDDWAFVAALDAGCPDA